MDLSSGSPTLSSVFSSRRWAPQLNALFQPRTPQFNYFPLVLLSSIYSIFHLFQNNPYGSFTMAVLKSLPNNPNIRVICYLFSLELGTTGSCHDEWFSVVSCTFRLLCWETLELSLSFSFSHLFTCNTEPGGGRGSPRRVPWHQAGEVHFACIT